MNKRTNVVIVALVVFGFLFAGSGFLWAKETKPAERCVVMGGKINKDVYVDHEGQRVYFCCAACIDEFNKDPEKYLKKMKEAGVKPEKTPKHH
jgi:YHS domain-containing protein